MDAKVTWNGDLDFVGIADSGFPIRISSPSGADKGIGPVEMTILALAACTAMDVVSILEKKKERVEEFQVLVHAERAGTYPKVITSAKLEYVVTGRRVREASLRRAIELSVEKYCPVHAMLSKAFPIELNFAIHEGGAGSDRGPALYGRCD